MEDHPVYRLRLSLMVTALAAQGCESCCQREADYIIYDAFVCASCAEVAK